GATTLRYYLSSNSTISSGDTLLDTDAVSALAAGGSSPESVAVNAPSSDGTYYVGACVDSVTGETSTGNNCSTGVQLTVTGADIPDLAVVAPGVDDSSLTPGQAYSISMTVENQGSSNADSTTLRYYRSTDSTISPSDTDIGTDPVSSLAASGRSLEDTSLSAPLTEGNYWIGSCVDTVNDEVVTSNNCSAGVKIVVGNMFPWPLFYPALKVGTQ
ncbi:MAG: hypothetical protein GY727_04680, partial [Gammaproteobacteria bacterium]|nr:hypothetical protein [Gammaproteobacteria bacterium]